MIQHAELIVCRTAAVDLMEAEGCLVTCTAGAVTPCTASTAPANVYGLLNSCNTRGGRVSVCLPGFHGQPVARLHDSSTAVQDGDTLILAADGKVKKGTAGTVVAKALAAAQGGQLVPVRMLEPHTAS